MVSLVLALIIIYIVAGIIGFVVHGLFWLFVVAAILFVITVLSSFFSAGGRRERRRAERAGAPADENKE